eukprot:g51728.t1
MLQRPYCGGLLSLLAVSHPQLVLSPPSHVNERPLQTRSISTFSTKRNKWRRKSLGPDIEEASHREIEQDWEEAKKAERQGETGLIRVVHAYSSLPSTSATSSPTFSLHSPPSSCGMLYIITVIMAAIGFASRRYGATPYWSRVSLSTTSSLTSPTPRREARRAAAFPASVAFSY